MAFRKKSFSRPEYACKDGRKCVLYWDNQEIYLGPWDGHGVPDTTVLRKYLREVVRLEEEFHARQLGIGDYDAGAEPSIIEAIHRYLAYQESEPYPDGSVLPTGKLASRYHRAVRVLKPLGQLYGDTMAGAFSAKDLRTLRKAMLSGAWMSAEQRRQRLNGGLEISWSPGYCNKARAIILCMFRYLESYDLVPPGRAEHLATVPVLAEGKPKTKQRVVPDEEFEILCQCCSPVVAALLRVQRLTAARPSELCLMRPVDIKQSPRVWIYTPTSHKTEHHGKVRQIPLGPECQQILAPLLKDRDPDDYLFKPEESRAHFPHWEKDRKTPIYPSEIRRRRREANQRKKHPRRHAAHFTRHTLYQHVQQAIARAAKDGKRLGHWAPYDVRHTRLTEVQELYGDEAAAAVAGHESVAMTKIYAHRRLERAVKIAAKTQKPKKPKKPK